MQTSTYAGLFLIAVAPPDEISGYSGERKAAIMVPPRFNPERTGQFRANRKTRCESDRYIPLSDI